MKVIFLDVDGVLNFVGTDATSPSGWVGISSPSVKILRNIVKETNAYIVLSSTWRRDWSKNEEDCTEDGKYLNRRLNRYGLHIIDKTIENEEALRGAAIKEWLDRHPHVESWIVLDDNVFMDFKEKDIMPHLVLVNGCLGLTETNAKECIKKLNETNKEEEEYV